jgi:hypothetical protein
LFPSVKEEKASPHAVRLYPKSDCARNFRLVDLGFLKFLISQHYNSRWRLENI